jgi:hypothetical protein
MRTGPTAAVLVSIVLGSAASAGAQAPAGERHSRFSLNLGVGSVGSTSQGPQKSAPAALLSVGTDVRLSEHWSLRLEVGRRMPRTHNWVSRDTMYYFKAPDGGQPIGLPSTLLASDETIADIALLARRAWGVRERFEIGLLTGLDLQVVRYRWHITIPLSLTDPEDVLESMHDNRRTLGVFDFGIEGGVHVTRRTTLLLYGIAGLQSPVEEHRNAQMRAGMIIRQRF